MGDQHDKILMREKIGRHVWGGGGGESASERSIITYKYEELFPLFRCSYDLVVVCADDASNIYEVYHVYSNTLLQDF